MFGFLGRYLASKRGVPDASFDDMLTGLTNYSNGPQPKNIYEFFDPNFGQHGYNNYAPQQPQPQAPAPISGIGQLGTPGPTNYAPVDPVNRLQTGVQEALGKNPSPLGYEYYRQAAMANPSTYQSYIDKPNEYSPFSFTDDQWAKYGGGGNRFNQTDSLNSYIGMTNDLHGQLSGELGRAPTQAELYASTQGGVDATRDAVNNQTPGYFDQYNSLFL